MIDFFSFKKLGNTILKCISYQTQEKNKRVLLFNNQLEKVINQNIQ